LFKVVVPYCISRSNFSIVVDLMHHHFQMPWVCDVAIIIGDSWLYIDQF